MKKSAFSLVELIIVVAVITSLISLLAPSLNSISYNAQNLSCMKNLRQIVVAQFTVMEDRDGRFHAIAYPRSLLRTRYLPNGYTPPNLDWQYYHENQVGYIEPYLGAPGITNDADDVYNCPAYIHNENSDFFQKMNDRTSTYSGFGQYLEPLSTHESYVVGQSNVGNPGPGFLADIYNKPIVWDFKRMWPGWNNTIGSVIHQNRGELPVAFLDGQVKLCFYPTTMWELPNWRNENETFYREWYQ